MEVTLTTDVWYYNVPIVLILYCEDSTVLAIQCEFKKKLEI